MDDRHKMAAGQVMLDWGFAETLAYASLLDEGYEIRLTGQDIATLSPRLLPPLHLPHRQPLR